MIRLLAAMLLVAAALSPVPARGESGGGELLPPVCESGGGELTGPACESGGW